MFVLTKLGLIDQMYNYLEKNDTPKDLNWFAEFWYLMFVILCVATVVGLAAILAYGAYISGLWKIVVPLFVTGALAVYFF